MTTTTEMTLTDRAVAELSEFNALIENVQPYADLTVAEDGIGKVEEAHKAVKRLNASIEKKRKELKAGALEYGRTVDSIAKQLTAAVDKIEGKLGAEREAFEAVKDAERKAKEAEKLAAIQKRIDRCQEIGVAFVLTELQSMADDDFEWWFAGKKKDAEKRKLGIQRSSVLNDYGFTEAAEKLADMTDQAWHAMLQEAIRQREELAARIAAEAEHARQFEEQQRKEREQLAAKLKAEQEELNRQRAELQKQQDEIAATLREAQEKRRAEERKRREDAAKPELERLQIVILEFRERMTRSFDGKQLPWWAPEFVTRFNQFAQVMENFVREGEGS